MKRRMEESELDSIPGVSAVRKRALLRVLGSVERISRAETEELAQVEGVGDKVAHSIREYFQRS
jgi:excinuclease ABC subunit C